LAVNKNEIVVRNFFYQKQERADGPYEGFDPFSPLVFNIETNTISEIPDNFEWPNYFYYRIFPLKDGNVQLSEDVNLDNFKRGYFKSNNLNFNNLEVFN